MVRKETSETEVNVKVEGNVAVDAKKMAQQLMVM